MFESALQAAAPALPLSAPPLLPTLPPVPAFPPLFALPPVSAPPLLPPAPEAPLAAEPFAFCETPPVAVDPAEPVPAGSLSDPHPTVGTGAPTNNSMVANRFTRAFDIEALFLSVMTQPPCVVCYRPESEGLTVVPRCLVE